MISACERISSVIDPESFIFSLLSCYHDLVRAHFLSIGD
jgi:hypothetical protein